MCNKIWGETEIFISFKFLGNDDAALPILEKQKCKGHNSKKKEEMLDTGLC
jgi:hypothetical protein